VALTAETCCYRIDRRWHVWERALLDRQRLETFAKIVQHKHFRRTATASNISPGTVSQRIDALEEAVGAATSAGTVLPN